MEDIPATCEDTQLRVEDTPATCEDTQLRVEKIMRYLCLTTALTGTAADSFSLRLAQLPVLPLLQMTVSLLTLLRVLISSASSGDDKPAAFIKGGKTKTNHWLIRDLLWAWEVSDCLCRWNYRR